MTKAFASRLKLSATPFGYISASRSAFATSQHKGLNNRAKNSHHRILKKIILVPSLSHHPSAANYLSVELAALKELSQELAELFGLTLPFSLKK
jgi:hypothetical protein